MRNRVCKQENKQASKTINRIQKKTSLNHRQQDIIILELRLLSNFAGTKPTQQTLPLMNCKYGNVQSNTDEADNILFCKLPYLYKADK